MKKKIDVIIEWQSGNVYAAIPQHDYKVGFFGTGHTVEEAMADLQHSYEEAKVECPELPEFEYNLKCDLRTFLKLNEGVVSLSGMQKITGINQRQLGHYLNGYRKPKKETTQRFMIAFAAYVQRMPSVMV